MRATLSDVARTDGRIGQMNGMAHAFKLATVASTNLCRHVRDLTTSRGLHHSPSLRHCAWTDICGLDSVLRPTETPPVTSPNPFYNNDSASPCFFSGSKLRSKCIVSRNNLPRWISLRAKNRCKYSTLFLLHGALLP